MKSTFVYSVKKRTVVFSARLLLRFEISGRPGGTECIPTLLKRQMKCLRLLLPTLDTAFLLTANVLNRRDATVPQMSVTKTYIIRYFTVVQGCILF